MAASERASPRVISIAVHRMMGVMAGIYGHIWLQTNGFKPSISSFWDCRGITSASCLKPRGLDPPRAIVPVDAGQLWFYCSLEAFPEVGFGPRDDQPTASKNIEYLNITRQQIASLPQQWIGLSLILISCVRPQATQNSNETLHNGSERPV